MPLLSLSNAIPATSGHGGRYTRPLAAMRGREVSGVYAIFDQETGERLYVGESHTGRLFDTITRHFRAWKRGKNDPHGGRTGGTTYNRDRVSVAWIECPADAAQAAQYKEIQDTQPRDNEPDGATAYAEQNPPRGKMRYRIIEALTGKHLAVYSDKLAAIARAGEEKHKRKADISVFDRQTGTFVFTTETPTQNPPRPTRRARAQRWTAARAGGKAPRIQATRIGTPLAIIYRHNNGKRYRHDWPASSSAVVALAPGALIVTNTHKTTRNGQPFIK